VTDGPTQPVDDVRVASSEPAAPWGWPQVLLALVGAIVMSNVVTALWLVALDVSASGPNSLGRMLCSFAGIWTVFLGISLIYCRRNGQTLAVGVGLSWRFPRDLVGGIFWGLCGQALVYLVYLPVQLISPETAAKVSDKAKETTDVGGGWKFFVLAIAVVLIAPVVEEIFFRGFAQRAFSASFGPAWGVASAAVLFGLFHFAPLQTPALIAFGFLLGSLARRNGRLGENIVAHIAFNGVTMIGLFLSL